MFDPLGCIALIGINLCVVNINDLRGWTRHECAKAQQNHGSKNDRIAWAKIVKSGNASASSFIWNGYFDADPTRLWRIFIFCLMWLICGSCGQISPKSRTVYRSNQPTAGRLSGSKRRGITNILDLARCREAIAFFVRSKRHAMISAQHYIQSNLSAPRPVSPINMFDLFDQLDRTDKPFLLHCKSGRIGLVLFRHFIHCLVMPVDPRR